MDVIHSFEQKTDLIMIFILFHSRLFRLLENKTTQMWVNKELFMCGGEICMNGLQGHYEPFILSFGEDEDGKV